MPEGGNEPMTDELMRVCLPLLEEFPLQLPALRADKSTGVGEDGGVLLLGVGTWLVGVTSILGVLRLEPPRLERAEPAGETPLTGVKASRHANGSCSGRAMLLEVAIRHERQNASITKAT
jgi:hypothetical protein